MSMSSYPAYPDDLAGEGFQPKQPEIILAQEVADPHEEEASPPRQKQRRVVLPIVLFLATCLTTFLAGTYLGGYLLVLVGAMLHGVLPGPEFFLGMIRSGLSYSAPLMLILACHEAGHFVQAHRYGVRASFPYFIPVPIPPLGTFGAVIAMDSKVRDRRALFDIGISGPLAGLVPTLIFTVWGLYLSHVDVIDHSGQSLRFGDPLIFRFLAQLVLGPIPPGHEVYAHPMAIAGWVGLLVTSLNLLPIGQLDGGHILYALLRNKAHVVASVLLLGVAVGVIWAAFAYGYPGWVLMLFLLLLMGPIHPPTDNDRARLGPVRVLLGWLTLAFIFVGLTPTPIIVP
jgi:membrane-associated protease RseP (regulator of RpoE activity)